MIGFAAKAITHPLWWAAWVLWWLLKLFWKLLGSAAAVIFQRKPAMPHGSAEWATRKVLKKAGNMDPGGFRVAKLKGRPVYAHRENSVVMFGPPGSGKSLTVISNLKHAGGWDAIVYDPTRTVLAAARTELAAKGYVIHVIDLDDPGKGLKYNPVSILRESTALTVERDAKALASLVVPAESDDRAQHFVDTARYMVAGLVVFAWYTNRPKATLGYVSRALLTDGPARVKLFARMKAFPNDTVKAAVEAFERAGDREKGSFDTTLSRKLSGWLDPGLRINMDVDPVAWAFEDMFSDSKPMAVFIQGGMGYTELAGPRARLVLGNAVNSVRRRWGRTAKPLEKGLRVFVDEAREIGRCEAIVHGQAELRKADVRIMLAYLAASDMRDAFGRDADMLTGTFDWIVTGGIKNAKFYQEVVELIGNLTTESFGKSKTPHGESQSSHMMGQRLITVDGLFRLGRDEVVCLLGALPVKANKSVAIKKGKPVF